MRITNIHIPFRTLQARYHAFNNLIDTAHAIQFLAQSLLPRLFSIISRLPNARGAIRILGFDATIGFRSGARGAGEEVGFRVGEVELPYIWSSHDEASDGVREI